MLSAANFFKSYFLFCLIVFIPANKLHSQTIACGIYQGLSICTNGTARSWGMNIYGQLGDGSTTMRLNPVQVNNISNVVAVGSGHHHTVFLKSDGTVWGSGNNILGQLGTGTTTNTSTVVQSINLSNITKMSVGFDHNLFLKNDSTVWTCGYNWYGQLGDSSTTNRPTPFKINNLNQIIEVSAGYYYSHYLKSDGSVWACGDNSWGQLGDGTTSRKLEPIPINTVSNIIAIASGYYHTLFLKNDGTVWACGANGGQLGDGTQINRPIPIQIPGLSNIIGIAAGNGHSLFLKNDGTVWACGYNAYGQLGDGTTIDRLSPIQITSLSNITSIATKKDNSSFLKNDGTLWTCGYNQNAELGIGNKINKSTPVQVTTICQVKQACSPPLIPISILGNDTICLGSYNIYNTSSLNPPVSYTWSFPSNWSGSSTADSIAITVGQTSGNISVTANNICGSSIPRTLNVNVKSPDFISLNLAACDSFIAPNGLTYYTSEVISDTLQNRFGCDSIINTNLTINYSNQLNLSISQIGEGLQVAENGASYNWYNCNDSTQVLGNTQLFYPTINDGYFVVVSKNQCIDTSNCFSINNISTEDLQKSTFKIFPNPIVSKFVISSELEQINDIKIFNLIGEEIKFNTSTKTNSLHEIELNTNQSGVYIVSINHKNGIKKLKLIKQ